MPRPDVYNKNHTSAWELYAEELEAENKRLWSEQHEAQRVYRRLLTELEAQRGINEEQSKQLAALKSISLNGALSWQDRHISSFKVLNPELLKEKGE